MQKSSVSEQNNRKIEVIFKVSKTIKRICYRKYLSGGEGFLEDRRKQCLLYTGITLKDKKKKQMKE